MGAHKRSEPEPAAGSAQLVDRLRAALDERDGAGIARCLAEDAVLELPQLRMTYTGRGEISGAADTLFCGFRDGRWAAHGRYLDDDQTMEEGVWSGTHNGPLSPTVPATGAPVQIRARLFLAHDDAAVTGLRLFFDLDAACLALGLPLRHSAGVITVAALGLAPPPGEPWLHVRQPAPPEPHATPVSPRHRSARRQLRAGIAAVTISIAAAGAVAFVVPLAEPTDTPGEERAARVTASPPTASRPASSAPRSPGARPPAAGPASPSAVRTVAPGVTQRGNTLSLATDVFFARDSAALSSRATAALVQLAGILRARKITGTVQVNGYTDSLGTALHNAELSRQRAAAVATALRARLAGVPVRLLARGFGESGPVAGNATETGRQHNRRVAIILPGG